MPCTNRLKLGPQECDCERLSVEPYSALRIGPAWVIVGQQSVNRMIETWRGQGDEPVGFELVSSLFKQVHGVTTILQREMQDNDIVGTIGGICRPCTFYYFDTDSLPNPLGTLGDALHSGDHEISPRGCGEKASPLGADFKKMRAWSRGLRFLRDSVDPAITESLGLDSFEKGIGSSHALTELVRGWREPDGGGALARLAPMLQGVLWGRCDYPVEATNEASSPETDGVQEPMAAVLRGDIANPRRLERPRVTRRA
jgi:hypothetical protein